jgi:hypothetical protein
MISLTLSKKVNAIWLLFALLGRWPGSVSDISDRVATDPPSSVDVLDVCEELDEDSRLVGAISADGESGDVLMVVSGMKMMRSMMSPLHWIC